MKGSGSTKPLSGMRDFLPADILRRRHVIRIVEQVYESYGFLPIETPAIENLSTLLGKYGDEGEGLLYRVLHRRDKLSRALESDSVTQKDLSSEGLRYDLTVPLARVVAGHRGRIPRFFKRYQIQPVWRADRPGKGRFREFFQCDLDITGTGTVLADVEVLHAASGVLQKLGFTDFRIRLNHRELLTSLIRRAGIPLELEQSALVALDKLDKIGEQGVLDELGKRGVSAETASRLLDLAGKKVNAQGAGVQIDGEELDESGTAALERIREILEAASTGPAADHLEVDLTLARGLGYYTGAIFEVAVPDLAGSLGGGGRYDGLIGIFGGESVPAVGFSLGLERLLVVMEERGMFPELSTGPDVLVCGFPDVPHSLLLKVAMSLRQEYARVELFPEPGKKLGQQIRYADELGAREVVIVGMDEISRGVLQVKDLSTGEQREWTWDPDGSAS
ncbi:MAG: histidine--tRNA ligase [Planctomycetota bacterium]|jgi:histidyl-tRNA synthetase|nr:histidine--tRNA ligase [Planctomycetota bacterium]